MSRSFTAFLITFLLYIVLLLLTILALQNNVFESKKSAPKEERRMKVSLKEKPKAKKDAIVKNQTHTKKAKPLPKGKQLKKLTKKPNIKVPKKVQTQKPNQTKPKINKKPIKTKPKVEKLPPAKPFIPLESKKDDKNTTKLAKKKEHSELYSFLSKEDPKQKKSEEKQSYSKRTSKINQDIKELYGDEFGKLSAGEQKYIIDNQEIMRRITQEVLNRVGRVNVPRNLRVNEENVIEFYLYPNGDISDIHYIKRSGFYILDDTTKETIEYAYAKYPRPEQKTKIRYKVGYYLRGY